jgi:hypothetical protein
MNANRNIVKNCLLSLYDVDFFSGLNFSFPYVAFKIINVQNFCPFSIDIPENFFAQVCKKFAASVEVSLPCLELPPFNKMISRLLRGLQLKEE